MIRQKYEKEILPKYKIICCTCMTTALLLMKTVSFNHVIIDEATQALEPEALMCLIKDASHFVLIGDIMQLGSIVRSKEAKSLGFEVSLIERLMDLSVPTHTLNVQYRMHPLIAEFSNYMFYNSRIENFYSANEKTYKNFKFLHPVNQPMFFYDVPSIEEVSGSGLSKVNRYEAERITDIINYMQKSGIPGEFIGIITFYDGQKGYILQHINKNCDYEYSKNIQVMSVDSAQGKEKEFIILSCVRANKNAGVGFLDEFRRLNVAMTRAIYGLIICGNVFTLVNSPLWIQLISFFNQKELIFTGRLQSLEKMVVKISQQVRTVMQRPNRYSDD